MQSLLLTFALFVFLLFGGTIRTEAQPSDPWKATWATAVEFTGPGDMPKESLSNRSIRQVVHVSFGGSTLRLKLSNEFSQQPVSIHSVYIADALGDDWKINAKSAKYLKFSGKKSTIIGAGKAIFSDALSYPLTTGQRLAITINYGSSTPEHATSHRGSRTTSYIIKGVSKPTSSFEVCEKVDHWYNLSAIDIKTENDIPVVAILGNSITDGRGSTTNHQNRWTDVFSDALNANSPYGVLNLGIGGNCVVEGGLSEPAMQRFDRDILAQSGISHLIIFEGTNDIGISTKHYEHVADTLIACYKVLIAKAKARGIKVYGATITPTKGNGWYSHWHEALRQTVNEWIRTSHAFDGIIDFDLCVRDPQDPQRLQEQYSDDWLHLNPQGYETMGKYAAQQFMTLIHKH